MSYSIGLGLGLELWLELRLGLESGLELWLGLAMGLELGLELGLGSELGKGWNLGLGLGLGLELALGLELEYRLGLPPHPNPDGDRGTLTTQMHQTDRVNLVILASVQQVGAESHRKASARVSSHRPFIAIFVFLKFHQCFIGCIRPQRQSESEPVGQFPDENQHVFSPVSERSLSEELSAVRFSPSTDAYVSSRLGLPRVPFTASPFTAPAPPIPPPASMPGRITPFCFSSSAADGGRRGG